jgi:hypothetical protein
MALFGVTQHGDYNQLLNSQPAHRPTCFENLDDSAFEEEFQRHILGDCMESRALQVTFTLPYPVTKTRVDSVQELVAQPQALLGR